MKKIVLTILLFAFSTIVFGEVDFDKQIKDHEAKIEKIKDEIKGIEIKITETKNKIKTTESKLEKLKEEKRGIDSKIKDLEKKIEDLKNK